MPHLIINDITKVYSSFFIKAYALLSLCILISACGGSGGNSETSDSQLSLSGKITVQRDSDIDLDLNQSNSLNNDIDDPQIIANPSTIGGYLSGFSGTYSSSNLLFNEDLVDHFTVALVEGQKIELSLFQADSFQSVVDLELALLDESKNVQANLLVDKFSSNTLVVPSNGLYILSITVSEATSPLLYTLSLSQTISNQTLSDSDIKTLSQDFVPGDVLVKFKEKEAIGLADNASYKRSLTSQGFPIPASQIQTETEILIERLVLKQTIPDVADLYQLPVKQDLIFTISAQDLEPKEVVTKEAERLALLERKIQTLDLIKQLNASDQIEFAEPNYIYHATASVNDPRLSDQWNLSMISMPAAWQVSTGQGVVVAVLDTGINASHEDLMNNIHAEGYDFISDSKSSGDGNGFDNNPNDEGKSYHGSHVAGVIAAEADNALGIAGLAYDAKIMPLRVLGVQDAGASSDIAQAILYAAGLSNTSGIIPSQPADIINMSFGGEALSETVKTAIDQAYNQGLILVAAAGNGSTDELFYPAAFDKVIGVGAVSDDKKRSGFSNFGDNLQLVAPGGTGSGSSNFDGFQDAILSTVNENNYVEYIGTSMAAPHVSAVAALMKELNLNLNGESFKNALDGGFLTENLSGSSPDTNNYYGKGLIDAAKALNWAAGTTIIPATLSVYPTKFGFIGSNTEAELSLKNPGSGTVKVISIEEQENWLEITQKNVDGNTLLGTYLVEANPALSALNQGIITINYQVNDGPIEQQKLNVFISRSSQTDSTVGVLFISLYKEEDVLKDIYKPAYTVGGQLTNGAYSYCFNSVATGRYLLTASTDNDRDQKPFDTGEAIGTFPVLSRPEFIEINNSSLNDMDFDIQHPSFVSSEQGISQLMNQNESTYDFISENIEWLPLTMNAQSNCLN